MSKELKTGAIAIITIALFIWGYNFLKGRNLFAPSSRYFYVEYNNIQGLKKSSDVTINGLQVGKVIEIKFNENPGKRGNLIVEIMIEDNFEFSKESIAKIYSASLMGGQSLAIIPSYEGDLAVSGDYLKGEVESDIFSSVGEKLNPLQSKLENVIVSADSLFLGLNQVLNKNARKSLNESIIGLETTLTGIGKTIGSINEFLDSSRADLKFTFDQTRDILENFAQLSDTLVNANIGLVVKKAEISLDRINKLMIGVQNGEGSLGKLITNEELYNNLTIMSKEIQELIREIKLNPKRFVQFSLFGRKTVPYNDRKNKNNESSK